MEDESKALSLDALCFESIEVLLRAVRGELVADTQLDTAWAVVRWWYEAQANVGNED